MDFNEYYSPEKYDPYSISSIFDYAKDLKGHTLADKCHSDILEKSYAGKGNFGHYLEKFYFGFNPDNNPEPDFGYVDVELKSGAIVETSKGFRAKERLAIGIINFSNITYNLAEEYLKKDLPYNCCGSFKIEGRGLLLIDKIDTKDPTAVIGLPMIYILSILKELGHITS